ncbi:mechanosensitive ion channel family protein [Egicoccus halophilus]|uniref:Mechanosensitive ion channel protein MscS n=1 Tax=Egicoccus halophilus TaxID=1670830 RepID=A0A8J3AFA9_9ACTN|nr:mechanosensitive ion channel family protein [Egicoccus halophilus]GGI07165.1 mechanosensitive ion channel protein MscS [Egicoccus halophilus]
MPRSPLLLLALDAPNDAGEGTGEEPVPHEPLFDPEIIDRPFAEWLQQNTDLPDWSIGLIENAVEPAFQVALIVLIAWSVLWLSRRALRRAVVQVKKPDDGPRRRRQRAATGEGRASYSERRAQRADALGALASSVLGVVIWAVALSMVLGTFGISLGPLIAGAGIVGIAVGFGAQDLVSDFLSGVFMLIEDQYGVGDVVNVGEATGVVEGVTLRTTRIRDVEGTLWHVPNGEIRRVGNMSQEWARALLDVSVAYGADVDVAADLIRRVASEMAHEPDYEALFLDEPEMWGVQTLGNDSVDLRLVIKTRPGEQWAIGRELRRRIKNAFDVADMEIPFPQRTVWLRTEQPLALGDEQAATFRSPVPPETRLQRAVRASKQGDTGAPNELADLLPTDERDRPAMGAELAASSSGGEDPEAR